MVHEGSSESYTYILLNRRVIEEIRKEDALRFEKSAATRRATDGASCFWTADIMSSSAIEVDLPIGKCINNYLSFEYFFMTLSSRAISLVASPALRSRLLSLPPACRILSLEPTFTRGRRSRPATYQPEGIRLYSSGNTSEALQKFKKSCK